MLRGLGAKLGLRGGGIRTPEGVGEKLGYLQIYIPVHGSNKFMNNRLLLPQNILIFSNNFNLNVLKLSKPQLNLTKHNLKLG